MDPHEFTNRNKPLGEFMAQVNEVLAGRKQELRQSAYDSLADIKNRYLLDQDACRGNLEKNVIYSAEGTMDVIKAMRVYVDDDYRDLRGGSVDDIVRFVQSIPVIEAKDRTAHHLRYLQNGCTGCDYHDQHQEYGQLKELRDDTAHPDKYREELEFNYVYHQVQNRLAKHYLLTFIQNDEEAARIITDPDDMEQIKMNLHLITNYILDNISFEDGDDDGDDGDDTFGDGSDEDEPEF